MANDQNRPVSDTERFLALKALREYLFLQHPARYASSDFIEDIPQLRPYSSFAHDLLPSTAVLNPREESRKEQIARATQGLQNLQKHKNTNLPKEMAHGALAMGASSIPVSLLFGGAARLISKGKSGWPQTHFRQAMEDSNFRNEALNGLGKDVAGGVTLGAAFGAGTPLMSHTINPRKKALQEASDILQKAPYASGLPGGDIIASRSYNKKEKHHTAKNVALGTAMGAGAGATGKLLHSGNEVATTALLRSLGMTIPQEHFHVGNIGKPTLAGAGIGAGLGLLTSALLPSKY